jgi:hypothetical protein
VCVCVCIAVTSAKLTHSLFQHSLHSLNRDTLTTSLTPTHTNHSCQSCSHKVTVIPDLSAVEGEGVGGKVATLAESHAVLIFRCVRRA